MDDFVRQIFENAVIREQAAQRMYQKMSEEARSGSLRALFLKLAEEEVVHEVLFRKADLRVLKIVNEAPLARLNLLEPVGNPEKQDINNALDFAIAEEQKAVDDYSLLLNHLDFGETREAFSEVAVQEKRHKTLLQKAKLEFNDNDWNVL
ncbi:MAG: ferritin family protein [archaeon]